MRDEYYEEKLGKLERFQEGLNPEWCSDWAIKLWEDKHRQLSRKRALCLNVPSRT